MADDLKRIKIGIIGCGSIAQQVHIPTLIRTPECELTALADTNFELTKELAQKYNIANSFTDYRELLECENVDAVSICTPPATHCQIALDACKAKKHILCEKPMAISIEEADQMVAAAKKADVKMAIGHQFRFLDNVQQASKLLSKNMIGRTLTCYGRLVGGGPFFEWKTSSKYHLRAGSGSDVLLNYGTHIIDLFNFFFKKALSVSGFVKERKIQGTTVGDRGIVTIEYEDGTLATLNTSYTEFRNNEGGAIDIYGVDGSLSINLKYPTLGLYKRGSFLSKLHGSREIVCGKRDFLIPYKREVRNFIESIEKDKEPSVSGLEGRYALEIALAAYQSYRLQRTITFPL